ncbi:MAG: hypothetical protein ACPG2Y_01840, partial [Acholeplasmataceae bacterium]
IYKEYVKDMGYFKTWDQFGKWLFREFKIGNNVITEIRKRLYNFKFNPTATPNTLLREYKRLLFVLNIAYQCCYGQINYDVQDSERLYAQRAQALLPPVYQKWIKETTATTGPWKVTTLDQLQQLVVMAWANKEKHDQVMFNPYKYSEKSTNDGIMGKRINAFQQRNYNDKDRKRNDRNDDRGRRKGRYGKQRDRDRSRGRNRYRDYDKRGKGRGRGRRRNDRGRRYGYNGGRNPRRRRQYPKDRKEKRDRRGRSTTRGRGRGRFRGRGRGRRGRGSRGQGRSTPRRRKETKKEKDRKGDRNRRDDWQFNPKKCYKCSMKGHFANDCDQIPTRIKRGMEKRANREGRSINATQKRKEKKDDDKGKDKDSTSSESENSKLKSQVNFMSTSRARDILRQCKYEQGSKHLDVKLPDHIDNNTYLQAVQTQLQHGKSRYNPSGKAGKKKKQ